MTGRGVAELLHQAVDLHRLGQLDEADAYYEKVLVAEPGNADALNLRGVIAAARGHYSDAVQWHDKAISRRAGIADFHFNKGVALEAWGKLALALTAYEKALQLSPDHAGARLNSGGILYRLRRRESAIAAFRKMVALFPSDPRGHYNLGRCLVEEGRVAEAEASLRRALALAPKYAEARLTLGNVYAEDGRFEDAVAAAEAVLTDTPNHAKALGDLGTFLSRQGKWPQAVDAYSRAIESGSGNVSAYINRGIAWLTMGKLAEGWDGYARRFEDAQGPFKRPQRPWPQWQGESLAGKSILVWGEQGVGDQILYGSILSEIAVEAGRCVVECETRLVPLFQRSFPSLTFMPLQTPITKAFEGQEFDFQSSILDLGRWRRREVSAFPNRSGYLLADAEMVDAFCKKYASFRLGGRRLIGLSWASASPHVGKAKSTSLEDWRPFMENVDAAFVNLQFGAARKDWAAIDRRNGISMVADDTVDALKDIDRFAAHLFAMDAVVTVSNSTAHLSGALGIPTAVVVPEGVGNLWYWFTAGSYSLWYPSVKVYRKRAGGSWRNAVMEIAHDLAGL